jgi:hypothetical protein
MDAFVRKIPHSKCNGLVIFYFEIVAGLLLQEIGIVGPPKYSIIMFVLLPFSLINLSSITNMQSPFLLI